VKLGQAVSLARVNAPAAKTVSGRIRKISRRRRSDDSSRASFLTEPPANANFLLGEFVAGKIAIASERGLIVPRSAVLPEEDHFILSRPKKVGLKNIRCASACRIRTKPKSSPMISGSAIWWLRWEITS